ncbi:hypothetical protein DFH11DRAFT_828314 [Phellopilus nigrolimitatus]|nr:hypothetical protein DFH11DRAFT_828314 [Phellopilus nigrolimitatus]
MNPESPMDRTARWVQQHAQPSYYQRNSLSSSRNRQRVERQEGLSSQQSSRTDLGGADHGVGSGRRAYAPQSSTVLGVAGSSRSSQKVASAEPPLSSSHHRSRSHSSSLPHEHHTRPQLNIPASLYQNPNLPAFVQGPPGSGYPMTMTSARPTPSHFGRAAVPGPLDPTLQVPAPLNPKKSRPIVQKRRPSLSGETFEPPARSASTLHHRGPENREPRAQGQGDVRRVRDRAASESRRRW